MPWLPISEMPGDGDSIWIAVLEHDGVSTHVEYAQTWLDVDGLFIHRYEGEKDGYGEKWPPGDVLAWMECDVPRFEWPQRRSRRRKRHAQAAPQIIAPIIHLNGDRPETLLEQLEAVYAALNDAFGALRQAAPNARNYYPEGGLLEKAIAQHQRRMQAITDLQAEIQAECEAILDQGRQ